MPMQTVIAWLARTPVRSFIVYPIVIALIELALHHGRLNVQWWGALIMIWGYLQYRLVGAYRVRTAGGGPGFSIPPDRILDSGPYAYVRNPMYLGHLIFLLGLAIFLRSWIALVLFIAVAIWFNGRVRHDETRLEERFGASYEDYKNRVKRWIPYVI